LKGNCVLYELPQISVEMRKEGGIQALRRKISLLSVITIYESIEFLFD